METWRDVERVGLGLPETSLGTAYEGSPALLVRTSQFARCRWDDADREILQYWVPEANLVDTYVQDDPGTYRGARGYSPKVVMAVLDRVDGTLLRELLVESWLCRAPKSLATAHLDLL